MATVSYTTEQVALLDPALAEVYDFLAAEVLQPGDAVALDANGRAAKASANTAGVDNFLGIVVKVQGKAVSVLKKGRVAGFAVDSLAYGAQVYVADTAGTLADTASASKTILAGRVVPVADDARTKVLYIDADWLAA